VLDMPAKKLGMDPLQLRLKNAARPGTPMIYEPKLGHGGYVETVGLLRTADDRARPGRSAQLAPAPSPQSELPRLTKSAPLPAGSCLFVLDNRSAFC
jgi:hypothetical protein